jgi:metal-sulfur cluster biosynthetic enzyme
VGPIEKGVPVGITEANVGGTPGQQRISSVSTPASRRAAWAASVSCVEKRIPIVVAKLGEAEDVDVEAECGVLDVNGTLTVRTPVM